MSNEPKTAPVKNVSTYPVDVGGRILAAGESDDLHVNAHAVHAGLEAGLLALVNDQPAENAEPAQNAQKES